jgi:hypothetical protein
VPKRQRKIRPTPASAGFVLENKGNLPTIRVYKRVEPDFGGFVIRCWTNKNSFMPITYRIDATRQRVFTHVTGAISAVDIVGHFEVARREGFLPYAEMIDASSIVDPTLSLV